MNPLIDQALDPPLFGLDQGAREARLDAVLRALTEHHIAASPEYRGIVEAMFPSWSDRPGLAGVPFVPVGIFKRRVLKSIEDRDVFKTITSSGTSGQTPSVVFVDRETAKRQTRALTAIMGHVLGRTRRPMLIVDTEAVLSDRGSHTARAAGVVGLMGLGRRHTFLLDADMEPRVDRLHDFLAEHPGTPLLIFGFTFMIWKHLYTPLATAGIDLSEAVVVHSGGWKQMEAEAVGNDEFKAALRDAFGIRQVVNFYGMAEQVGSVFIEGDDGLLHPASFADVIVRNPETWEPQPVGEPGVLQVLSAVPTSYPGHSILTEDRGVVVSVDDPGSGMGGKAFRVLGRLPRAELRGCSDTYAVGRSG